MKRTCKQCGKEFELSDSEIDFFKRKGLRLPKRCEECRQKNRKEKADTQQEKPNQNRIRQPLKKALVLILVVLPILTMGLAFCVKWLAPPSNSIIEQSSQPQPTYILNNYRHKFHCIDCPSVQEMNDLSREYFYGTREEAIRRGYRPCKNCQP